MPKADPSLTIKATRYDGGGATEVQMRGGIAGKQLADALASIIEQCWEIAEDIDNARSHPSAPRLRDMIQEHWEAFSDGDYCHRCGGVDVRSGDCSRCGSDDVRLMAGER